MLNIYRLVYSVSEAVVLKSLSYQEAWEMVSIAFRNCVIWKSYLAIEFMIFECFSPLGCLLGDVVPCPRLVS
jgi:hypothetical protein